MELIIKQTKNYHVSLDTISEFEQTILSDPLINSANQVNQLFSKSSFLMWRLWGKCNSYLGYEINPNYKKPLVHDRHLFSVLMGCDFRQCLPYFAFSADKSIYMFDAWPTGHESIIRFANFFKVNNIFFSSSKASELIQNKVNGTKCYWIPEGIKPELYKHYPYENKNIDVLSFGRRYEPFHEQIVSYLQKNRKVYLYQKVEDEIIFPTRGEFIDGLAKSKISICFPSSITHPNRSGSIETMTIRYLQSMISKCIVLGHAPKEMITLFGYNPVVEIDWKDPVRQLQSILNNFLDYYPLVEKNYNTVMREHTWMNRWDKIKKILSDNN